MPPADAERFARLDALFQQALEIDAEERPGWLDQHCAKDPDLRTELEALLREDQKGELAALENIVDAGWREASQSDSGDTDLPETATMPALEDEPSEDPERIGAYRILGRLGRGGLATVFLAEREGEFSMPVALKRIRRGMDTDDILHRLRLERQILARLVHPNIARIHDGGSDEDGRPFLVMEVIEGQRIDEWFVERQVPLRGRLEVLAEVCEAVDYAHQNLVLHRDLKPSNIMVTTEGVPKLLDFGIAKMLRGDADDEASMPTVTRVEQRLLTPEYASPEQLYGLPLTTASDVYSLGVVLYQLCSGRLPHHRPTDDSGDPAWAWLRRDSDPAPMSTAARRAREAGEPLAPALDRFTASHTAELNAVVAKALESDPIRRYGNVSDMADDLRRLLADRPVLARHQTLPYRLRKLIRRHRTGAGVAALVALSLLAAVVGTSWQAAIARQERQRAEAERYQAEEVGDFLVDLFEVSDPYGSARLLDGLENSSGSRPRGETVTARELLDAGARRVEAGLSSDLRRRSELRRAIAHAYLNLSLYDRSRRLLEAARDDLVALDASKAGADSDLAVGWASVLRDLGVLDARLGRFDEAEDQLRQAERLFIQIHGNEHEELAGIVEQWGRLEQLRGALPAAQTRYQQALEMNLTLHGEDSLEVARARVGLAHVARLQGRYPDAALLYRQVRDDRAELLGRDHPLVLETENDLALSSNSARDYPEAQKIFERLLAKQRELLGEDHGDLAATLYNLAAALNGQGDTEAAGQRLAEAWALASRVAPSSPLAAKIQMLQALLHERKGEVESAASLYQQALTLRRQLYRGDHPEIATTLGRLGRLLVGKDDVRAESLLREALEMSDRAGHGHGTALHLTLGELALGSGRFALAVRELRQGLTRVSADGGQAWLDGILELRLAQALLEVEPSAAAASAQRAAERLQASSLGAQHPWTQEALELAESLQ